MYCGVRKLNASIPRITGSSDGLAVDLSLCLHSLVLSCLDIDECKENPNHCQVGVCQNLHGSYKCICPSGFTFDPRTKNCEGKLRLSNP